MRFLLLATLLILLVIACGAGPAPAPTSIPTPASTSPPSIVDTADDGGPTSSSSGFSRALGANVEEDWIKWDVMERDWKALVALYQATGGDNWTNNEGWLTDTPLGDWYGVNLLRDGRVDDLDLENNNLIGEIPAELADLTARYLVLSKNQLSGEIPEGLCSQATLNLSHNQLSGQIPQGIVGCGSGNLFLNDNQLSGEIPAALGTEPDLGHLHLDNNQLSGAIPAELGNSTWRSLRLNNNPLTGCIPHGIRSIQQKAMPQGMEYCE